MARRGPGSDISIDRYDDRRSYVSRGPRPSRGYDERYQDEELDIRQDRPRREREVRERDVLVREEVRERERPRVPPQYFDEDYGRTGSAGPLVLRARETEEFDFAPRPRRRSPSPEPEKKIEKEEIIIRREESEHRPPPRPRERSREREEIIIRKTEDDRDRGFGPPRREEREREEIIIRKTEDDRDRGYGPPRREDRERDEIIIRRDERRDDDVVSRRGGRGGDVEREEIIIRKDERDSDSYVPRSRYDDYAIAPRPISHERERSRTRHHGSDDGQEIIIRREEREGRNGDREKQEIIIRKTSHSRSPSPSSISTRRGHLAPDPPIIRAPPIHQEVITHHRHIDHGYETALVPRPISRPPSPPMPPLPREAEDRIEIHRSGERNGRAYDEDIVIDRNEGPTHGRSRSPLPPPGRHPYSPPGRDPYYDYPPGRPYPSGPPPPGPLVPHRPYHRDVAEEAAYYDDIARRRGFPGEAYNGATRDWAIVDVPPGTERVRMDGVGGGEQEITWQRYNGVRRSNFNPDGGPDEAYGKEVGRPLPLPSAGGEIGARYGRPRDPKEGLWTEITKDLVVVEAIRDMGYEYEETEDFYYIMQYLQYVSHTVRAGGALADTKYRKMWLALWACPKISAGIGADARRKWNGRIGSSLHDGLCPLKDLHIITTTAGIERLNATSRGRLFSGGPDLLLRDQVIDQVAGRMTDHLLSYPVIDLILTTDLLLSYLVIDPTIDQAIDLTRDLGIDPTTDLAVPGIRTNVPMSSIQKICEYVVCKVERLHLASELGLLGFHENRNDNDIHESRYWIEITT